MIDAASRTDTRASLIEAGLELFGKQGFEGTPTRQLAALAKTNIASITYHFGGKTGLRAACAETVAEHVSCAFDSVSTSSPPKTPEDAQAQIERQIQAFVELIVGTPSAQDMVAFMLREITSNSQTARTVYASFFEPRHTALCILWAIATGRDPEDHEVKLAIFALLGQVVYFRAASAFVMQRMSWEEFGATETQQVTTTVISNLRDAIERHRK